jgi:hypothetical protein
MGRGIGVSSTGAAAMSREYFERTNPVPEYVAFNEKRNQYCWQKYSNAAAPFNDKWESFCDGLVFAKQQHSGMVSITVDCAKFLHDTLSYTTEETWDAAVIEQLYELNSAIKAAQERQ